MKIADVGAGLLLLRLIGSLALVLVLLFQVKLFGSRIDQKYVVIRRLLFVLAAIAFIGNFVPIVIDIWVIYGHPPQWLGILYAVNNAVIFLCIALALALAYWMADRIYKESRSKQ